MAKEETYYAYSRFDTKINKWGRIEKSIHPGDEVTQSDLKASDEDWAEYIKLGVVSRVPYPDTRPGETPNDVFLREDNALADDKLDEDAAEAVKERQKIQAEVAGDYQAAATALASAGDNEGSVTVIEEGADAAGDLKENAGSSEARDYDSMTVAQMKTLANKREIQGSSNMNQAQLIEAHKRYDEAQPVG
jgi:hypothetical protein